MNVRSLTLLGLLAIQSGGRERPNARESVPRQRPAAGAGVAATAGAVAQGCSRPRPASTTWACCCRNRASHRHTERAGARSKTCCPIVSTALSEQRTVINLAVFGFQADPSIIGPFNIFDARIGLSQPLIDLRAFNDYRAAALNERAETRGDQDGTRPRRAGGGQSLSASGDRRQPDRRRARAAGDRAGALPAGVRPQGVGARRRRRRPPRSGANPEPAPALHRRAERLREGQAAARASHRAPSGPELHPDRQDSVRAARRPHARGRPRASVRVTRRLPRGARSPRGGGSDAPRGRRRAAPDPSPRRRLRHHRPDPVRCASDLHGRRDGPPAAVRGRARPGRDAPRATRCCSGAARSSRT